MSLEDLVFTAKLIPDYADTIFGFIKDEFEVLAVYINIKDHELRTILKMQYEDVKSTDLTFEEFMTQVIKFMILALINWAQKISVLYK